MPSLTPAPPVCLAASRRRATLTCSTRALPRLKPAQPGCWKGRAAPYHCPPRAQVPHGGQLRLFVYDDCRSNLPPPPLLPRDRPTHPPRHPAADDRSKNLRPKRNIRTAMNHEIMLRVAKNQTQPASCICYGLKPYTCSFHAQVRYRPKRAIGLRQGRGGAPNAAPTAPPLALPLPRMPLTPFRFFALAGVQVPHVTLRRHVRCCHQTP